MKIIITLIALSLLLIPPAMADLSPTSIDISGPVSVGVDDWVKISGTLTKDDGTQLYDSDTILVEIDTYVNTGAGWEQRTGHLYPDENGEFYTLFKIKTNENVQVKFVMGDHASWNTWLGPINSWGGLKGCSSSTHLINVGVPAPVSNTKPLQLIGYAKGLFMLAFFSSLFITIIIGCISTQSNEPQKKANAEATMFHILQVLFTVTVFYLAVLFLAP